MTVRARGLMVFAVAIVVVGPCSVVFADAGTAVGAPCGRTHVWAQAQPGPQPGSALLLDTVAVDPDIPGSWTAPGTSRLVAAEHDDLRVQPVVQSSAPRAPPAA